MKTFALAAFIFMTGFMGGYVYRDNTLIRTLTVHVEWPKVEPGALKENTKKAKRPALQLGAR